MSSRRLVQNNGGSGWGGGSCCGEYDHMNESKRMHRKGTWTRVVHQKVGQPLLSKSAISEHCDDTKVCVCVSSRVIFSLGINKRN